jgi:phage terminase large subunit
MTAPAFDWKNPDYIPIFAARMKRLAWIREDPANRLPPLKAYYRDHVADFINDWGVTVDPRNVERGLPARVPMVLFPRQREWIDWVLERWRAQEPGLTEKSRDCGVSWLFMSTSCTLCLFYEGMAIGAGSRKEEYVDKSDAPKSLFWKGRTFLENLPPEFRGGWTRRHAPHMRIMIPETGSSITGEAGDGIGRGDRAGIYGVDESAYLERPALVDASLSATTNCRQDISSVNGMGNSFATRRWSGKIPVFIFDWRDDPRKDQAWYDKQVEELDAVTVAQEIDRNYNASTEGQLIPAAWVVSAIDAHKKLGIAPTGAKRGAFDVADEGKDKLAFAGAHGWTVEFLTQWSGKGDDIFESTVKVFGHCDDLGYAEFTYDADGLGAGVRGDSRIINDQRRTAGRPALVVHPFRGSGEVTQKEQKDVGDRKNEDYFYNQKAQSWFALRRRFLATHRAVTGSAPFLVDDIISLDKDKLGAVLPLLQGELSQIVYKRSIDGKMLIDKTPDGMKSPNLADAVMILFNRAVRAAMVIADNATEGV